MNYAWIIRVIFRTAYLQYIRVNENCRTEYCGVKCAVPQGSILGPLRWPQKYIFLTRSYYVCRWHQPLYTHSNIQKLFSTVNEELASINQWFASNKLSLNAKKTKDVFFHKPSKKDDIPFILRKLTISNHDIESILN